MKQLQQAARVFALSFLLLASTKNYAAGTKNALLETFKASTEYSKMLKNYGVAPASVALTVYKDKIIIADLVKTDNSIIRAFSYFKDGQFYTTIAEVTTSASIRTMTEKSSFTGNISLKNINGEVINGASIKNNALISSMKPAPTEVTPITDCVAKKIDAMGWVEYSLCAITAPECLASLVLICAGEIYAS